MSVPHLWHRFILMFVNYYYHHFVCYTFLTKQLWEEANILPFVQLEHSLGNFSLGLIYYILIFIVVAIYRHNLVSITLVKLGENLWLMCISDENRWKEVKEKVAHLHM